MAMRPKLTYANVMATVAVFIALGGASYAALKVPRNSVGSKQLKKNSVVTAKVKNEAITAAKVKKGTLTGTQINVSALGTVPSAQTAQMANTVAPSEPFHEVGTDGEPQFQNGCKNLASDEQTVRFYKDHEGVVHLEGRYFECAKAGDTAFQLPAGYRPKSSLQFGPSTGPVVVVTSTSGQVPSLSGDVRCSLSDCIINGITFRAES
jgi:hypothetical protein